MRGSLKGVLSRAGRLEERVHPAQEEWVARLSTMSDAELYGRMADAVEGFGGAEACFALQGFDAGQHLEAQRILRERQASRRAT